ncbi:MAG TPA: OmpH family outer membrane protein [Burkholderiales bacterium]|nr:OmpH family outer membrane protein [Burkholderiales bacterium]
MLNRTLVTVMSMALIAGAAIAQAEEFKLGVVNRARILAESAPAKRAQAKLEKEFKVKDDELKSMAKQARELQTSIEKESVTLPASERTRRERELANLNHDFQRAQREFREDINLRRNEEVAGILDRVDKVIKQIAVQERYDLILEEAVFVRPCTDGKPCIDITEKVLKVLAEK